VIPTGIEADGPIFFGRRIRLVRSDNETSDFFSRVVDPISDLGNFHPID
jgi:hypothetical protein